MSKITRTIEGDKNGIIEHLEEQRAKLVEQIAGSQLVRRKERLRGEIDGLDFAIAVLRDWKEPSGT